MNRNAKTWSIITLIVLIAGVIAANYLGFRANADTGDIANNTFNDTNYFFPATYVFTTIWPVIYAGIVGWAIYQALPANRENPRFRAAAPWLMVNIILNGLWVWVFGLEAFVSTLPIMAILVFTAVVAYRKLRIGQERVDTWERVLQIPISIYLAWLTVATVANIAAALIAAGWNGFGISYEVWGLIMLLVGAGLAFFLYRGFNRDVVIPLVYLYAYVGIIVRYTDEPLILAGAAVGAAALVAVVAFHFINRRGQPATARAAA
ncbi:TspO/MBR family protein [Promineifilum sp.]|uniref:TspO/MBR family protein n=1 Tax=Promineifilum sp. TaxID=2664178 RepID=UPI0035AE3247